MPRYFTHLYNSEILRDERGEVFADLSEARAAAQRTASELIAEHISQGIVVNLDHRLEVIDETGKVVIVLPFAQLFQGTGAALSSL